MHNTMTTIPCNTTPSLFNGVLCSQGQQFVADFTEFLKAWETVRGACPELKTFTFKWTFRAGALLDMVDRLVLALMHRGWHCCKINGSSVCDLHVANGYKNDQYDIDVADTTWKSVLFDVVLAQLNK